jgi:hypothetical protein
VRRLSKAQQLALQHLIAAEAALLRGDWASSRDNAIKLAALSAERTQREGSSK